MPSAVAKSTVIELADGLLSETVKTIFVAPEFPSVIAASVIVTSAVSSLEIVPSPCASAIVAALGLVRFKNNVSACSTVTSPFTTTDTVLEVCPAAKVSVPLVAT